MPRHKASGLGGPHISIVVPVYNVATHVAVCLRSIAHQTEARFECLVIDDGSTDGSGAVVRQAIKGDARFRVIAQANRGLSAARNVGLEQCQAPYLVFVDGDDALHPRYLERLLWAMEHTGADWVSCGLSYVAPDGSATTHPGLHEFLPVWLPGEASPERHDITDWRDAVRHYPSAWNKIYRRDFIGDVRFDEGTVFEDHSFFLRLCAKSRELVHLAEPLYRQSIGRPGQITADGSDQVFQQFAVLDQLRGILSDTAKPSGPDALATLATRLLYERFSILAPGPRQQAFIDRARRWIAAAPIPMADPAHGIPLWWVDLMNGGCPMTVILRCGDSEEALRQTLESLDAQDPYRLEIIGVGQEAASSEWPDELRWLRDPNEAEATNRAIASAQGDFILILRAGDTLPPSILADWHHEMRQSGAWLGLAPTNHCKWPFEVLEARARLFGLSLTGAEGAELSATLFRRSFVFDFALGMDPGAGADHRIIETTLARTDRVARLSPNHIVHIGHKRPVTPWGVVSHNKGRWQVRDWLIRCLLLSDAPPARACRACARLLRRSGVVRRLLRRLRLPKLVQRPL